MVGPLQWVLLLEKGTDNQPALLHTFQYSSDLFTANLAKLMIKME